MENYSKGKNIEEPLERDKIPIVDIPSNFLWMQVRGGSKIRNLLSLAFNEFPQVESVLWTGFGPSTVKAVTCAEIMKKEYYKDLYQITKICYRLVQEFWDPKIPELEQLVVTRKLPMIHILLSLKPLDSNHIGYQISLKSFDNTPNQKSIKQVQQSRPKYKQAKSKQTHN